MQRRKDWFDSIWSQIFTNTSLRVIFIALDLKLFFLHEIENFVVDITAWTVNFVYPWNYTRNLNQKHFHQMFLLQRRARNNSRSILGNHVHIKSGLSNILFGHLLQEFSTLLHRLYMREKVLYVEVQEMELWRKVLYVMGTCWWGNRCKELHQTIIQWVHSHLELIRIFMIKVNKIVLSAIFITEISTTDLIVSTRYLDRTIGRSYI